MTKILGKLIYLLFYAPRYFKGEIVVIDVSQSVEHDHPHALEFLRKDCNNINGICFALSIDQI